MKNLLAVACVLALALTGCSSTNKELGDLRAKNEVLQAEHNKAVEEAQKKAYKAAVKKVSAEAAAEAVKKLQPPPPPTREDKEFTALGQVAKEPGSSILRLPVTKIDLLKGGAATEQAKGEADEKRYAGKLALEALRFQEWKKLEELRFQSKAK